MATTQCEFKTPVRNIRGEDGMQKWLDSEAYVEIVAWIKALGESVKGMKISEIGSSHSPVVGRLLTLLDNLSKLVDETPCDESAQRFGNTAFRKWLDKIKPNVEQMILEVLPEELKGAVVELVIYFREGFGNYTRIDYGTGHELKFMAFLCCLMKIGAIPMSDAKSIALKVCVKYLELVRKLQLTYRMEPAGSHGVWGLDDFQFIPFIWGASQLIGNKDDLSPKDFPDKQIAQLHTKEYVFMSCIDYINSVKTGPFYEHSNTLWSISAVPDWGKVCSGLLMMYKAEVLGKIPVVQHFPFGSILSIEPPEKPTF